MDPSQLSPELRPPSYRCKGIHSILTKHMMETAGHSRVPITFAWYFTMRKSALQIETLFKNLPRGRGTLIFIIC